MAKKLISLNDYNALVKFAMMNDSPVLNGIACPICGEELYDSNPMTILTSHPPQKKIYCSKCDYAGFRLP